MEFYDIPVKTIKGQDFDLHTLKGKKVIVVNTASECGYTPQYVQLKELCLHYNDEVTVLAFPCNQFGAQEPGSAEQIDKFCQINYSLCFPLMEKTEVKGDHAHSLFKWLTHKEMNGVSDVDITWNFQKFLIDENGRMVKSIDPAVSPLDEEILDWLKRN